MKLLQLGLVFTGLLVCTVIGPPVKEKKPGDDASNEVGDQPPEDLFTMEYGRYLKEVVQILEKDDGFREKLQNASEDDIKSGKIALELQFVNHSIRSKLDEIKRQELDRMRKYAQEQYELSQGLDRKQLKIPKHIDHRNPHTFEIDDLRKLILQTTRDLEENDRKRRADFKEYEMEKERLRLEKLKAMDEEHRKKAEQEFQEQEKRHKEHPKLHHPGSKQQLEEVWEKQDQLPADEFDPKTFFRMHDLNGDNTWSQDEVNALFQNELNKMYDPNAPEDDIRERYEEMERMREHVFNETDTNNDGLISFEEFIYQTKKNDFEQDPGWQGLDEQPVYTRQEYEEFERRRQEEYARMAAAGINPYGGPPHMGQQPIYLPPGVNPGPMYHPVPGQGQGHYPQQPMHPQQGYHPSQGQHPQQGYHPQQQGQHPQQGYHPPQGQQPQIPPHPPAYQQGMHAPYQPEQQQQFQQMPPHQQNQQQQVPPKQVQQQQPPVPVQQTPPPPQPQSSSPDTNQQQQAQQNQQPAQPSEGQKPQA